jgi:hypothetical protein
MGTMVLKERYNTPVGTVPTGGLLCSVWTVPKTLFVLFFWVGAGAVELPGGNPEHDAAAIVDSFYNLDFEQALVASKELEVRYPGYPAGAFYRAVIGYQRLRVNLSTDETQNELEAALKETLALAEALESSMPAVSHFYQGAALGFQARNFAANKQYGSAIPKARRGVRHLRKAIQLNPEFEDAYLGLGMYDYFMARIPAAAKPFAFLAMGDWGNRKRGLEALHRTAEKGSAAKMEARSILAMIYINKKEQNWEKAAELLEPLMHRYPGNPRYRLALIYVRERQLNWDEAERLAESTEAEWIQKIRSELHPRVKEQVAMRLKEIAEKAPVTAFKWPATTGPE